MKALELDQMECLQAGDFLDGAYAVVGFTAAGIGIRAMIGTAVAISPLGLTVLGIGGAACLARQFDLSKNNKITALNVVLGLISISTLLRIYCGGLGS
jgi:hypothetical protein